MMLGEILGRNAGEIAADIVLCLFLFPRPPPLFSGRGVCPSESEGLLSEAPLGVLVALSLADLAESVGVLCSSSLCPSTSIRNPVGREVGAAASGRLISSIGSLLALGCCIISALPGVPRSFLGIFINVAGVTALLDVDVCDCCDWVGFSPD